MTYENINNLLLKQVDNISRVSANASIQGQIYILKQVMIYLQSEIQKLEKREEETSLLPTKEEAQQMSLFPETMNDWDMGILVEKKVKEFIEQGNDKKTARRLAHGYCQDKQICRACSNPVRPDNWSNKRQEYCLACG